jgi:hypothetical protein
VDIETAFAHWMILLALVFLEHNERDCCHLLGVYAASAACCTGTLATPRASQPGSAGMSNRVVIYTS